MECPHCRAEIEEKPHYFALGIDPEGEWKISSQRCRVCDRLIVFLTKEGASYPVRPLGSGRAPLGEDVPAEWAAEYQTAGQVLAYSKEASAAISRRLLHRVLAACSGAGYGGLASQIERATASPTLPEYLKEALRAYAWAVGLEADDLRSYRPEALVPVAPQEAELLLDLLQPLLDFYFVQPARLRRKLEALAVWPTPDHEPPAAEAPGAESQATRPQAPVPTTQAEGTTSVTAAQGVVDVH
jgi:hypothetical protein